MKDIQKIQEASQLALDSAIFVAISGAIIFLLMLLAFSIGKFVNFIVRD